MAKKILSDLQGWRSAAENRAWDAISVANAMDRSITLLRYTELLGLCEYQLWNDDKVVARHMHDDQLPDWLMGIVQLGRIGGHFIVSEANPPTQVLWAELDEGKNLVRFVDHNLINKFK